MREVSLKHTEFAELSSAILGQGGSLRFRAHGSSMSPFIQAGDLLTVQPVEAASLRVGDVVFYRTTGDRAVVHRVVGRRMQSGHVVLATRGDAVFAPDEPVQAEHVLGRVVSLQRGRKIIRQDAGWRRRAALLWARLSPLGPLLYRLWGMVKGVALRLLRCLQGLRPYRVLARKVVGGKARYRVATADDASEVSRLYRYERFPELGDPHTVFARQLDSLRGCGSTLIATVGGRMAGAVVVTHFPQNASLYPDWWLFGMLVRTRYGGAGIGQELGRMALEKAAQEGGTRVNLLVSEQNRVAINLYREMGFRPACIPELNGQLEKEARQGGQRRIIMSRPVGPSLVSADD